MSSYKENLIDERDDYRLECSELRASLENSQNRVKFLEEALYELLKAGTTGVGWKFADKHAREVLNNKHYGDAP